jgi:WD40 repeat protein
VGHPQWRVGQPTAREAIQLWHLGTTRRIASFARTDWPVTALAVDEAQEHLVAVANDEVSVWRLADRTRIARVDHGRTCHSATALPGGRYVVACGGELTVHDMADGRRLGQMFPHSGLLVSVATDRTGTRLASVGDDQSVRMWDVYTLGRPPTGGHSSDVVALSPTPDGRRLLSAAQDGTLLCWDARTGELTTELGSHDGRSATIVAVSDTVAVSAGWDGTIRLWDLAIDRCTAVVPTGDEHVGRLACARDGKSWVTASTDGVIRVWHPATRTEQATVTSPDKAIAGLTVLGDDVLWATESGLLHAWNIRSGQFRLLTPNLGRLTTCQFGGPAWSCVLGLVGGELAEIDADGWLVTFGEEGCGASAVACDPGGTVVVAAYGRPHVVSDNTVRIWSTGDRSAPAAILVGDAPFTAAAVSHDSSHVYVGDTSGAVHVLEWMTADR